MFEYADYAIDDKITKLELLKPNGTSLGELNNVKDIRTVLKLGGVSELSFTLPDTTLISEIMLNKEEVIGDLLQINVNENSQRDFSKKTLVKYLIRATYTNGNQIIYIIPSKGIQTDLNTIGLDVKCYSLEYELSSSIVINYIGVPIDGDYTLDGLSLEEVLRDILKDSLWNIKFLDEDFNSADANVIRRTVDGFNNISILAVIDSLMSTFGGIAEYDTLKREISVYKPDNYEHYKFNGLEISDYNYLNEISQQEDTDNMITRLYGLGKDNLTINAISPTGTSYLEDLSYFLYPAEMNDSKELIKSSRYMSDELALAELKYEEYLLTQSGLLNELFIEQGELQKQLLDLSSELFKLETDLKIVEDKIDIKVGLGQANESDAEYVAILEELDIATGLVNDKNTEIDNKQNEIDIVVEQIKVIYEGLKIENHFNTEELNERRLYIYEGLYTNTGIAIEVDLYDEMVEYLKKYNTPNITLSIGVKDIFSMQNKQAYKDRDKIRLGEQVDIYYKKGILEVNIRAQIMEISLDEEGNNMELVISNVLDYKKNSDDWISKILQRGITTSTVVDTNKLDWDSGKLAFDDMNELYTQGIDAAKIEINSAVNNTVKTNNRGITVTDTTNPLRFVRITNGVMALSKDGGRTFATAISADGVLAERLIGQLIVGNQLEIIGDNGTLNIGNIPANTYPDLNIDDFGIDINSNANKIFITRERGFKIVNKDNENVFYADVDGNLFANNLTVTNGEFSGNMSATTGSIGGWNIDSTGMKAGTVNANSKGMLSGNDIAFYAGNLVPASSPFRVYQNGGLFASNVIISGNITASSGKIADYTISGAQLIGSNVGMSGTSGQGYAFWAGSNNSAIAPFRVGHDGVVVASNLTVTGGSINGNIVSSGINAANITVGTLSANRISGGTISASNFNVENYVKLRTNGHIEFTNNTGFFTMGPSYDGATGTTHPYMSGANVSINNGISFRTGTNIGSAGSEQFSIKGDGESMVIQLNNTPLKIVTTEAGSTRTYSGIDTTFQITDAFGNTYEYTYRRGLLVGRRLIT